jgi:hypothetical protein
LLQSLERLRSLRLLLLLVPLLLLLCACGLLLVLLLQVLFLLACSALPFPSRLPLVPRLRAAGGCGQRQGLVRGLGLWRHCLRVGSAPGRARPVTHRCAYEHLHQRQTQRAGSLGRWAGHA